MKKRILIIMQVISVITVFDIFAQQSKGVWLMDTVFCGNTYFIVYKPECLDVLQSEFAPDVNNGPHISCMFKKSETDTCSPRFYILIIDGGRYPNTVFSLPGIQYSCEKKEDGRFYRSHSENLYHYKRDVANSRFEINAYNISAGDTTTVKTILDSCIIIENMPYRYDAKRKKFKFKYDNQYY